MSMINEINEMSYPEIKQKLVEMYGKDVSFLKGVTALYLRVQMLEQQIEELQNEEYGEWIDTTVRGSLTPCCSECGCDSGGYNFRICPNCGAKMRNGW